MNFSATCKKEVSLKSISPTLCHKSQMCRHTGFGIKKCLTVLSTKLHPTLLLHTTRSYAKLLNAQWCIPKSRMLVKLTKQRKKWLINCYLHLRPFSKRSWDVLLLLVQLKLACYNGFSSSSTEKREKTEFGVDYSKDNEDSNLLSKWLGRGSASVRRPLS